MVPPSNTSTHMAFQKVATTFLALFWYLERKLGLFLKNKTGKSNFSGSSKGKMGVLKKIKNSNGL